MAKPKTVAGTTADPIVRFAKLEIDGEAYNLCFDFNSMAAAEALTGINMFQKFWVRGFRLDDLNSLEFRALFYASLTRAKPEITLEQAGDLVRPDTLVTIYSAIVEAVGLSMPEKKELEEDELPVAVAS